MADPSGADPKLSTVDELNELTDTDATLKESSGVHKALAPWSALRGYLKERGVRDEYLVAALAILIIALSICSFLFQDTIFDAISLNSLGYLGVFLITLIGSATIFLPSGGGAAVILAGAVLNPFLVGLIAGTGATLGELTGYAIGYQGGGVVERWTGAFAKTKRWMEKHGTTTIFVLAIVPNPIFDAAGLAAGAIRFPLGRFITLVWTGKTLQAIGGALIGAMGSEWLINLAESLLD